MTLCCEGSFTLPRGLLEPVREAGELGQAWRCTVPEEPEESPAAGSVSPEVRAPFPFSPHGKFFSQSKAVSSQAQLNPK